MGTRTANQINRRETAQKRQSVISSACCINRNIIPLYRFKAGSELLLGNLVTVLRGAAAT